MKQQTVESHPQFLQTRNAVVNYLSRPLHPSLAALDRLWLQIRILCVGRRQAKHSIRFRFSYLSHLSVPSHFTLHEFLFSTRLVMYRRKAHKLISARFSSRSRLPPIRCCASCFLSKIKFRTKESAAFQRARCEATSNRDRRRRRPH